jgi:hypothetical protein
MTDEHEGLADVPVSQALRELVALYPLPEAVPDADVSQIGIGKALDLSTTTMGKYVSAAVLAADWESVDQFPVIEQGGMGRPYLIRMSHAWAWSQHRATLEADRRRQSERSIQAMQASLLGLKLEDEPDAIVDPDMRRKMAQADLVWNQAESMRRRLVKLDEVTEMLEAVFGIIRDGIESMPDRLERELGLKPEQVDLVVRLGDDILNGVMARIEEAELKEREISDVEVPDRILI